MLVNSLRKSVIVAEAVKPGTGGRAVVEIEGEDFTPEQISAMILSKMKADAEKYLGETVGAGTADGNFSYPAAPIGEVIYSDF